MENKKTATITIKNGLNGMYYYTLNAPNGIILMTSERYYNLIAVNNAIASVRKWITDAEIIELKNEE